MQDNLDELWEIVATNGPNRVWYSIKDNLADAQDMAERDFKNEVLNWIILVDGSLHAEVHSVQGITDVYIHPAHDRKCTFYG